MDVSSFASGKGRTSLLGDLVMSVEMRTESSVSLSLGRFTNKPDGMSQELANFLFVGGELQPVYEELGWIDVHYPCVGPIKALFRLGLPSSHQQHSSVHSIVRRLFELLAIPAQETYIAHWHDGSNGQTIIECTNQLGTPDKFNG